MLPSRLPNVRDYNFIKTKAMPASATTAASEAFDLLIPSSGQHLRDVELLLTVPHLTVAQIASGTHKYDVQDDTDPAFGSPRTIAEDIIVQTAISTGGATAASRRFRLPSDCQRYVRVVCTKSDSNDASDSDFTVELLF